MEENKIYYILYKNGRAFVVSKEKWEASWLNWFNKSR